MISIGVVAQEFYLLALQCVFLQSTPHLISTFSHAVLFCFGALIGICTAFVAMLAVCWRHNILCIEYPHSVRLPYMLPILHETERSPLRRLGFSVTCVILRVRGQMLASSNPVTLPLVVGVVVVGIGSLVPSFVGYNLVHVYRR